MMRSRFFNFMTLAAGGLVLFSAVAWGLVQHTLSLPVTNQKTQYLYVEPGDGLQRISSKAHQLGLVERRWHFLVAARALGQETALRAGEYAVPPGMSIRAVIDKITAGDVFYRKLVVPEGLSVAQIEDLMVQAEGLVWSNYEPPAEGSLLPETYFYTKGETASGLIMQMQNKMKALLDDLWAKRVAGLPIKNRREAVILASIVEKETGQAAERPIVAAVFINRLKRKMRLQSDPTVVYGITYGRALGRALTSADLATETAFNTYRINGLPPTPIANPGAEAIAAVLAPANVTYLYFVADGSGGHAFSTTLKGHNRNVRAWRRLQLTPD